MLARGLAMNGTGARTYVDGRRARVRAMFAAMRSYRLGVIAVMFVVLLSACSTLSYYAQSISGQLRLMSRRQQVATLLADPATDADLKQRLTIAQEIRDFASGALGLPDNDSYRGYVQLSHPFVIWSLFATPEFSLESRQWCFPIVGCVPYRGYFAKAAAQAFAQALRAEGADVFVGGVPAYSTLGWFDDPLLSSMLAHGEAATAAIIFHELAHQQVYVPGDTAFNEAFAVAVEKAGVRRWLKQYRGQAELRAYEISWRRRQEFFDLVESTRARLSGLYRSGQNTATMREAKRAIIADMRADYEGLKRRWNGYAGYDYWFEAPINNAKLIAVAIYRELVPDFERWLAACGGDFARFYRAAEEIGELEPSERRARLNSAKSCS
jgi:predicted aminopeptidase